MSFILNAILTAIDSLSEAGCDETGLDEIPYGEWEKLNRGAIYKYRCEEGAEISGSETIFCDGRSWNDTVPKCTSKCSAREATWPSFADYFFVKLLS